MPTCLASQQMKKLNSSAIHNVNILQKIGINKDINGIQHGHQQDVKTKTKTHHLVACNEFSFQISTYPSRLRSRTQVNRLEAPVDSRTARLHGEGSMYKHFWRVLCRKEHMVHFLWFGQKPENLKVSKICNGFGKDTKKDYESVWVFVVGSFVACHCEFVTWNRWNPLY